MISCMNYREEILKIVEQLPGRTRDLHFTIDNFMPWNKYYNKELEMTIGPKYIVSTKYLDDLPLAI